MRKMKLIMATILIIAMSLATYVYFKKQPVESIPKRATLVLNQVYEIKEEV